MNLDLLFENLQQHCTRGLALDDSCPQVALDKNHCCTRHLSTTAGPRLRGVDCSVLWQR